MKVVQSIIIQATREEVFDYLLDVNNRKDYIPALEEIIMLDNPPIRLGSRYIEVAKIGGRRLRTSYEVIRFEKNGRLTARTTKSIFPIVADLTLTGHNNSTTLLIELTFMLRGIFKLGSAVVEGIVEKQAQQILFKVKSNVER